MPHTKSQIKRLKKSEERRMRNKSIKSTLKTKTKKFYKALESSDEDQILSAFKDAARAYDKAVSKGVIHKRKAARKKSRMARHMSVSMPIAPREEET